MKPFKHVSTMKQDCAVLLYALVKGYEVKVRRIIKNSILDYVKGKFLGNIPYPCLITLLCIKGGVKFNEEEGEKCPNASPLTLAGVLKALVESKEGERREKTKKRKRVERKEPKDQTPAVLSKEGANN